MQGTRAPLSLLLAAAALLAGCGPTRPDELPASEQPAASGEATPNQAQAWHGIGRSAQGRTLWVAQTGEGSLRILVVGGIHGDETEGRSALESIRRAPPPGTTLRLLRDLNPDGTAAGRRTNANGFDLNRNWPTSNFVAGAEGGPAPLSEPETRLLSQELRAFAPHVVVVLHSSFDGPFVNFDGPASDLAAAFAAPSVPTEPWTVKPYIGYPTPGSLGTFLGIERGVPTLTLEFRRGQDEAWAARALKLRLPALARAASMHADVASRNNDFGTSGR